MPRRSCPEEKALPEPVSTTARTAPSAAIALKTSWSSNVITSFNAGTTITFPLYVYGAARVGVPPQVNVMGTVIFVTAVGLMLANVVYQRRRALKGA